jgi:hypothetical protein
MKPTLFVALLLTVAAWAQDAAVEGVVVNSVTGAGIARATPGAKPVETGGATIRGNVEHGGGATVLLWPSDFGLGDWGGSVVCDASGNFEFTGLAPGDYYALPLKKFSPGPMMDPARLRLAAPSATTISVEDGKTASVQLRLALAGLP